MAQPRKMQSTLDFFSKRKSGPLEPEEEPPAKRTHQGSPNFDPDKNRKRLSLALWNEHKPEIRFGVLSPPPMIPLPSDPFETGSRILWERIDFLFKNLRFYKFEEGSLERFLDVPQSVPDLVVGSHHFASCSIAHAIENSGGPFEANLQSELGEDEDPCPSESDSITNIQLSAMITKNLDRDWYDVACAVAAATHEWIAKYCPTKTLAFGYRPLLLLFDQLRQMADDNWDTEPGVPFFPTLLRKNLEDRGLGDKIDTGRITKPRIDAMERLTRTLFLEVAGFGKDVKFKDVLLARLLEWFGHWVIHPTNKAARQQSSRGLAGLEELRQIGLKRYKNI